MIKYKEWTSLRTVTGGYDRKGRTVRQSTDLRSSCFSDWECVAVCWVGQVPADWFSCR